MTEHTGAEIKQALDAIFDSMPLANANVLLIATEQYAVFQAMDQFAGRDRRRIKREVRKAADKARAAQPKAVGGIDRAESPFWRRPAAG